MERRRRGRTGGDEKGHRERGGDVIQKSLTPSALGGDEHEFLRGGPELKRNDD